LQTIQRLDPFNLSGKELCKKVYDKLNNEISTFTDQEKFENSFATSWNPVWGNIILNQIRIPKEEISSEMMEIALNIVATGNFAFKGMGSNRKQSKT
jgi:predicted nucleic acid-binding protein